MNLQELQREAQSIAPWITETRRALHRVPEAGFAEYKTQKLIAQKLDELGIPYTTERTWIVAQIDGALPGKTVALRADIDALPVDEPDTCPFHSEHEGWMHACGHDAHAAILLGAAKMLMGHRDHLRGSVRLLFQPAEETVGGAEPMVAAGVLDGVGAVYGLHVQPYMNVGQIDTRPGTLNASTDELVLTIRGVSGHAARPEQGVDAIVCAGHLIAALQTIVSRSTSPLKPAVVSFGTIHGGTAQNVICGEVVMSGTLRTVDPELRETLQRRVKEIAAGIAATFGAEIEVTVFPGYAPLVNDPAETDRVLRLAREMVGESNVFIRTDPSMGGEDFAYFNQKVPGAYYHIGCATEQPAAALHSREFTVDERCLPLGAAMHCAIAFDYLEE